MFLASLREVLIRINVSLPSLFANSKRDLVDLVEFRVWTPKACRINGGRRRAPSNVRNACAVSNREVDEAVPTTNQMFLARG